MSQMQMYVPPLTRVNKIIIIATVSYFILNSILMQSQGISLEPFIGLSLGGILQGFVTGIVTYPIAESGFLSTLFSCLLLWFIGGDLEGKWGRSFYVKYLAVSVISTGLFYVLVLNMAFGLGGVLKGLSGINFALLLAYGMIYSDRYLSFMLIFPIKARYFCAILAVIELYTAFFTGSKSSAFAHLAAMLFAFIYLKYKSLKARGLNVESVMKQRKKEKMRSKLHIVKDPDEVKADPKNPKYWQ